MTATEAKKIALMVKAMSEMKYIYSAIKDAAKQGLFNITFKDNEISSYQAEILLGDMFRVEPIREQTEGGPNCRSRHIGYEVFWD